jgi:hypothetical protein
MFTSFEKESEKFEKEFPRLHHSPLERKEGGAKDPRSELL